tara:strand:- start:1931 stop:2587 length:657 start_codon:yes stop_codon:yes gene_type:complete
MSRRIVLNREEMASRLMEGYHVFGVLNQKRFIIDEIGWEQDKKEISEYYICDFCLKSTIDASYDEIGYGFSHSKCIDEHEKYITDKLGPLAQQPYGVMDGVEVKEEKELVIDDSAKKPMIERFKIENTEEIPNALTTTGIRGQMQAPPEGDVCEYIYHSNDDGKTIYRTKYNPDGQKGDEEYELVEDWQYELRYVIGDRAAAIVDTGWQPDLLREPNQ